MQQQNITKNLKQAVVTELSASGNKDLTVCKEAVLNSYIPTPNPAQEHTNAMFFNGRDIYAYPVIFGEDGKPVLDENGVPQKDFKNPKRIFWGCWHLSAEEMAMKKTILADPDNKKLNEDIWAGLEREGLKVDYEEPQHTAVRVIGTR